MLMLMGVVAVYFGHGLWVQPLRTGGCGFVPEGSLKMLEPMTSLNVIQVSSSSLNSSPCEDSGSDTCLYVMLATPLWGGLNVWVGAGLGPHMRSAPVGRKVVRVDVIRHCAHGTLQNTIAQLTYTKPKRNNKAK